MSPLIIISAILGLAITLLLIPLALRFGWGTVILKRPVDWHHSPSPTIPRMGGAVLVIAFVAIEFLIGLFQPALRANTPGRNVVVVTSLAMFALGFWDDVRPLGAVRKLAGQVLIAAAACLGGIGIEVWRVPGGERIVQLGVFGPVLTIVWLVGLTNLVNLADGIDGFAGGMCLMLMILVAAVAHQSGHFELLACGMAGALLGFLCFNFPPARIYLGDGGAYFLGFQIGLYSILNSHRGTMISALVAPLFVLALPITDAMITIARRGLRGLPLFRPDRKHLHHRLVGNGHSRRKVVLWVYGLNVVFLIMGLAVFWSEGQLAPILLVAAVMMLLVCAVTCRFSRRWFAVHRVVRNSLMMRGQVRYALSLAHWLELESRRRSGPDELWPNLVFAAEKLGFASLRLTLQKEQRSWKSPLHPIDAVRRRYDCPNGRYGSLEFSAPACPLSKPGRVRSCDHDGECALGLRGCIADTRLFETISDLLAEAWNKAATQWQLRRLPVKFRKNGYEPETFMVGAGLVDVPFSSANGLEHPVRQVNGQ